MQGIKNKFKYSPEVWKDQPYDLKSDTWSLGCLLFEIISLKPPLRAENMEGLYNKVIKGKNLLNNLTRKEKKNFMQ
jgi:serine/threonine protein kinase